MDKYISCRAAIEELQRNGADIIGCEAEGVMPGYSLSHIRKVLDSAPTEDVVPVVRCKNCKWYAENNDGWWFGCQMANAIKAVPEDAPGADDFCSFGERMEVAND